MMKYLAKLMMILGVMILLIPTVGKVYTKHEQKKIYNAYLQNAFQLEQMMKILNETLENDLVENNPAGNVREEFYTHPQPTSPTQTPNGIEVMGLLTIPKLDLTLMLVEGVTTEALKFAVGHMPGTALPGEVGNIAIAGHRSYTFGEYFNRVDELEIGDEIQITIGKDTYTYKVYESFLVEPTEISVTEPQGDKSIVTLITCHPVINATHRLIVRAELVETRNYENEK